MSLNRERVKLRCINIMRNYTGITNNEDFLLLIPKDVHILLLKTSVRLYILLLFKKNMNMIVYA